MQWFWMFLTVCSVTLFSRLRGTTSPHVRPSHVTTAIPHRAYPGRQLCLQADFVNGQNENKNTQIDKNGRRSEKTCLTKNRKSMNFKKKKKATSSTATLTSYQHSHWIPWPQRCLSLRKRRRRRRRKWGMDEGDRNTKIKDIEIKGIKGRTWRYAGVGTEDTMGAEEIRYF